MFEKIDEKIRAFKAEKEKAEQLETKLRALVQGLFKRAKENNVILRMQFQDMSLEISGGEGQISFREETGHVRIFADVEDFLQVALPSTSMERKILEEVLRDENMVEMG